jgi:hypothetical protein
LEDLLDPLDQEVHRERSGKQASSSWYQSQVDHGAIVGGALSCRSDLFFFQISVVIELVVQQFVGFW